MNDAIASLVRRHDPDRFLTALFAPPDRRDALLTLYAFNHELARAREVASEPPLALIRLQWWREVVEGEPKRHEVATPLSQMIANGRLKSGDLLPLIEARETEVYQDFETTSGWRAWLLTGAGGLAVAAASALGSPTPHAFRAFGAAYGVAGLLRSTGALASHATCLLPRDLLGAHGLSPEALIDSPGSAEARAALDDVVREGRAMLTQAQMSWLDAQMSSLGPQLSWSGPARPPTSDLDEAFKVPADRTPSSRDQRPNRALRIPREHIAAALPAVLAQRDLAQWPVVGVPRRLGDRLAVILAGVRSRINIVTTGTAS